MLPHLADRPLTMIRMPDGIHGQRFFQKHWPQERPAFAETVTVYSEHKDEEHEYLLCNNLPTLLWLAQSGTLEFHVWHSRARLGPRRNIEIHRLRQFARSAWTLRSSTTPTTSSSTSTPTSIPARKRRARNPSSTPSPSRRARKSPSPARAAAGHGARAHRQDFGQDRPARVRADQAHARFRRRAPRVRTGQPAPHAPASRRTSPWSGASPSGPARFSWTTI